MDLQINCLDSGGLITNYYCTSSCRHCLYCCSPRWPKDYMDQEILAQILRKIKSLGCNSVHIGGGEPFLNLNGLEMVVETTLSMGVDIEYVETNSSWYRDSATACQTLSSLHKKGLSTLLISISPFHNEHIPFFKVKGVIEACRKVGMNVFPWIAAFYDELDAFDDKCCHGLSEYEIRYGPDYLRKLPSRYWIHFGGRALKTFAKIFPTWSCNEIVSSNEGGCNELLNVSHYHFDLFGNYIPGLCSGIAIDCHDLGKLISREKYPFLHTLFQEGVSGLFELVSSSYRYRPTAAYISKCHLCLDMRRYLVLEEGIVTREFQPRGFYENL